MPGQLAERVRQKYPGAYDDMDDAALEAAVLKKYPQYQDLVEPEPTEEKSVGGFLKNIGSSAGRMVGDLAQTVLKPIETAKNVGRLGMGAVEKLIPGEQGHEQYADAVGEHFKGRYGGLSEIGNTLYNDPVGVAGDLSTLLGSGAGVAKGVAAVSRASAPLKIARGLRAAEHATNPMRIITEPAGRAARAAGVGIVRGTVRPPAAVRDDFGGSREIAQTIIDERLRSATQAGTATTKAKDAVDALLAEQQAAGVAGVSPRRIVSGLRGAGQTAKKDVELGLSDQSGALADRARRIKQSATEPGTPGTPAEPPTPPVRVETQSGPDSVDAAIRTRREIGSTQNAMLPSSVLGGDPALTRAAQQIGPMADLVPRRLLGESATPGSVIEFGGDVGTPAGAGTAASLKEIPLTRANTLKRRAQDRAYEAKGQGLTTQAQGDEGIAQAFREAIEERVPQSKPMNQRTQRLLGATKALEAAEDRPKGLTNMASIGAGSALGLGGSDPLTAILTALAIQAADSSKFGTTVGISASDIGKILRSKILNEMALAGRAGNASTKDER